MHTPSGSNPEFTETIVKGVGALRGGQHQAARLLFGQAVRADPRNATAWYWLSRSVDDERQRQDCLTRVKQLDQSGPPGSGVSAGGGRARAAPDPGTVASSSSVWTRVVSVVLVVALVCAVMPVWFGQQARAQTDAEPATEIYLLEASGVIRGEEVLLSSEYGGQISAMLVREGEPVLAGQALAQLDTALLDAQIGAAQAAISLAKAGRAQVRAGARPGQIVIAEAQLAQADAGRLAARQAVSDTMALVENPQEIRMQIAVLQAQIEAEQHRLAERLAFKDAAEIGKDQFTDAQDMIMDAGGPGRHQVPIPGVPGAFLNYTVPSLPFEAHLAPNYWWQAWVGVNATAVQVEGLEASLNQLYAQRQNPQALEAQVDQALSALAQAEAQAAIAQAQVDALRSGTTEEQIAALEARVEQAHAALSSLRSQRDKRVIRSPIDGIVVDLTAHAGEVAARGATVATVADLTQVKLTVYVPETQIGHVSLGQAVQVSVDSFAERTFKGTVTHISDTAEFTPRNVATQEERVNLVFAVEISMGNQDGALKPGMPADARLGD